MALMAGVLLLALGATLDLASVDDPKINFHDPASSTVSATIESTNSTPLTLKVASSSGATPTAAVRIAATGAVSVNTLNVDTLNVTTDVVVNGVSFNALQAQLAAVNTLLFGGPNGQAADFVVQRLVSMGVEGTPLNFSATGAAQSFTVPSGIHLYKAVLFGAAGGGGSGEGYSFAGGCGGYTVGYLPVVQGDVLSIQVGQGGDVWRNAGALARPYPSGGQPGTRVGYDVGQGGGRSAIMRERRDQLPYSNVYALVAGGGGGSGALGCGSSATSSSTSAGGNGGGSNGNNGGAGACSTIVGGVGGGNSPWGVTLSGQDAGPGMFTSTNQAANAMGGGGDGYFGGRVYSRALDSNPRRTVSTAQIHACMMTPLVPHIGRCARVQVGGVHTGGGGGSGYIHGVASVVAQGAFTSSSGAAGTPATMCGTINAKGSDGFVQLIPIGMPHGAMSF